VRRNIWADLFLMVAGGLISQGVILMAQDPMNVPGRYISKTQIMEGLDKSKPPLGIISGQSFQIVPDLLVRRRLDGPNNASIHSTATDGANITEVIQVIDGSGTLVTGGTFADTSTQLYEKKDRTKGLLGGEAHEVKAGDFVVIPPGTSHWFSKINNHVTIVEIRFPGDVTKDKK
jgi:mannose-6-phosphate isomerase-like protein (cupin superfamily)